MRKLLLVFGLCLFFYYPVSAQEQESFEYRQALANFQKIIDLIKKDDAAQLAKLVSYPLRMPNPIPDIKNTKEFVSVYRLIFDLAFKKKLANARSGTDNVFQNEGNYGIFNGDIWIDPDGKIIAINYTSPAENKKVAELTKQARSKMYAGIALWKTNIIVCNTKKYLVRVDEMNNGDLRYISWSKPKTISDKPDLIIFGGKYELRGTQGGITYTFMNNGWSYIVDEVDIAESEEQMGAFLRIYQGEKEVASYKCQVIK